MKKSAMHSNDAVEHGKPTDSVTKVGAKPRPRTNIGKQMFSYQAIDLWHDIH